MRSILMTALLLSPAMLSTPAIAQSTPSRTVVSTADLDLASARDRVILHRRINSAIEQVCGQYPSGSMLVPAPVARCRKQASAQAQPQMAAVFARRNVSLASR